VLRATGLVGHRAHIKLRLLSTCYLPYTCYLFLAAVFVVVVVVVVVIRF